MDVSIIIVNYNTLKMTQACIDSVFNKTTGVEFEVILVDNGSTDGSKEHFTEDNRIKYIYCDENLGFGRANNLGYDWAKGDYLFLLNSDTYLVNNAVYILWRAIKEENRRKDDVACAGSMLLDKDGRMIHSYARFPSKIQSILKASLYVILWKLKIIKQIPSSNNYDYNKHKSDYIFDVDYITGADLMVRKAVADNLGLFDPEFFMYSEESEMQFRYMMHGYRRIIVNGPEIVHLEGKSNAKHSPRRVSMVMKSQFLYFKKTNNIIVYHVYSIFYKLVYALTYLLCFPFINGRGKEKLEHLKAMIYM